MAKATKKTANRPARTAASVPAARYPRSTMTRAVPVAEAQDDAPAAESAPVVAIPSMPKRVAPEVTLPKNAPKANAAVAATRAAQAVKEGRRAARAAAQPMVARRSVIRAENFGYVLKDLRIIAAIAVVMAAIMIVLRFVLKG